MVSQKEVEKQTVEVPQEQVEQLEQAVQEMKLNTNPEETNQEELTPDYSVAGPELPEGVKLHEKKLQKIQKQGGKKGVEIEGQQDMGGLKFFCTNLPEFAGQGCKWSLVEQVKQMNWKCDPSEEERKGGSGNIGKMVFAVGEDKKLSVVQYVPSNLEDECSQKEWLTEALSPQLPDKARAEYLTKVSTFEGVSEKNWAVFHIDGSSEDQENEVFQLKLRDPMISNQYAYLRKKDLFPEDDEDSDEEYCYGDEDFDF